ncbi:MAG: sugar transferase [Sedimentisphaerales bacterium]|nr:sugar transferase [Sedimentisphaerales bacterium]
MLKSVITQEPFSDIVFDCLYSAFSLKAKNNLIALPQQWHQKKNKRKEIIEYSRNLLALPVINGNINKGNSWVGIINGRFLSFVNNKLIEEILANIDCDVLSLYITFGLKAYREKISLTSDGCVAGFRRLFADSVAPARMPSDWPHRLYICQSALNELLSRGTLPLDFRKFTDTCKNNSLDWLCFKVGGTVLDLEKDADLLALLKWQLTNRLTKENPENSFSEFQQKPVGSSDISPDARLYGNIVFGDNVKVEKSAVILGPAVLGDNVRIESDSVIRTSMIGQGLTVTKGMIVDNQIVFNKEDLQGTSKIQSNSTGNLLLIHNDLESSANLNNFKTWPFFSYAGVGKRLADIIFSSVALIMLFPFFVIVALIVKLTSSGPVFFKDKRQGLHGVHFNCLKFRTMIVDAHNLQNHLRTLNQVDGPQFSIKNDPRTSPVGKFMRDTFIDEVPQFINVLRGHMSVVGPRPSPESENILSPSWRDARLSVRPGVTGLWQACRTRHPQQDFQEWIAYDKSYVKNLSLKLDVWICCLTIVKIFDSAFRVIRRLFTKFKKG